MIVSGYARGYKRDICNRAWLRIWGVPAHVGSNPTLDMEQVKYPALFFIVLIMGGWFGRMEWKGW